MIAIAFCVGLVLGSLLMNLEVQEKDRINKNLKNTINNLEYDLDTAESMNKQYQEEHEILLTNASEQRTKIVDLENNIELLTNNLSEENKELVDNLQTEN